MYLYPTCTYKVLSMCTFVQVHLGVLVPIPGEINVVIGCNLKYYGVNVYIVSVKCKLSIKESTE